MPGEIIAQKFEFHVQSDGILLTFNGRKILFYQSETKSLNGKYPRANYIHPLYGLNGEVLTEDFPDDHLHQRGIYWAWHQLYVKNQKAGNPWICENIVWDVQELNYYIKKDRAIIKTKLFWLGQLQNVQTDRQEKMLKEVTIITCRYFPDNHFEFDFDINLAALWEGTKIGGSENIKGYGGFSARLKLPDDITFYSRNGIVTPRNTAVNAGGWIDILGTFDPGQQHQTGITIMCNPKQPTPFHGWILRAKASMQNPAFPGEKPVAIEKGETLTMRYKLVIHPAEWGQEKIEEVYTRFVRSFY